MQGAECVSLVSLEVYVFVLVCAFIRVLKYLLRVCLNE